MMMMVMMMMMTKGRVNSLTI